MRQYELYIQIRIRIKKRIKTKKKTKKNQKECWREREKNKEKSKGRWERACTEEKKIFFNFFSFSTSFKDLRKSDHRFLSE